MNQELAQKDLGSEGKLLLKLEGGKLMLSVVYDGKGVDGSVNISADSDYFMDKLAELIPGKVDDAIINILKVALKA